MILKGGFLLSSVFGIQTRTTMDMDISLRNHTMTGDELNNIFSELIAYENSDGLQ